MRRQTTRWSVAALVAALAVAGCGGSGSGSSATSDKTPKAAFSAGLHGLTDTDALTVTIKLDTTPSALIGFAKESNDTLSQQKAQAIATGQLTLEAKSSDGTHLSAIKPGKGTKVDVRLAFTDNGNELAQLLSTGGVLYAKAQMQSLLELFGKGSTFDTLKARVSTMPPFAKTFVNGGWVSLDLASAGAAVGQLGVNTNGASAQKLAGDVAAVLDKDSTVTRVGTDSTGDHLRVTTQSRTLVTDIVQAVSKDVPGASVLSNTLKPQSVPQRSVVLDAWVSGGALAKLSLDLVQFAKPGEAKPGDHLPVVLRFDRSGDDISKPSGAVEVNITQLFTMLGSAGG
jgi:hypothetical protein